WTAVAEPVLHQVYPQHGHQRVGRSTAFTLGIVWLDQCYQTLPEHNLSHLDQDSSLRGCLRLPAHSASAKGICFIEKLGQRDWPISPETGSLLQNFSGKKHDRDNGKTNMLDHCTSRT